MSKFLTLVRVFMARTRTALELTLQKASKTTDLRIPASVCTMFNVLVDAKKQSTKLCALDGGEQVSVGSVTLASEARGTLAEVGRAPRSQARD